MTDSNVDQRASWNGDSGVRWAENAEQRDRVLAPVAEVLLATASPGLGERVIDVGCGCGVTTLAAASAVGPKGSTLGIDLSVPMLEIARQRASEAGLATLDLVVGDAQTHPFDPGAAELVISRFGTMFFADLVAAFRNIGAGLAAGGRLCIATWQPLVANEWLIVPGSVLLGYTDLPTADPGAPGMFAQSDPDQVTATLRAAGFTDIEISPVEVTFTLGESVDDAAAYLAESGPGRLLLDTITDDHVKTEALAAVRTELAAFQGDAGVRLRGGILITTATWAGQT